MPSYLTSPLDNSILLVDIGNSTVSWVLENTYTTVQIQDFKPNLIPPHQSALVSCVAHSELISHFSNAEIISPNPYKNIHFDYDLKQLGTDRFLAIIAAYTRFPQQHLMIIDIGTFVTIDYLENNQHISGGITPGLAQLKSNCSFSGADSRNAWDIGVKTMLIGYIEKQCVAFKGKILITGGGQNLVKIKQAEYHQNLVLAGLKIIKSGLARLGIEYGK